MDIAIFGANGATGRLLTSVALKSGHSVTALVRKPQSFPYLKSVHVIEGSAFDPVAVAATVADADVVFTALGAKSPFRNENVLPRAVPLIVAAMKQSGVRRIIALGSAGARPDALTKQPAWRRWIVQTVIYNTVLKWPVREQIAQHEILSASGLDWTMVLPPVLTNARARGTWRVDGDALPRHANSISRKDVADFMFRQIDSSEWLRKSVYISD
jgi:putative NADH-flavin reductase